jgi:hypothetical protein
MKHLFKPMLFATGLFLIAGLSGCNQNKTSSDTQDSVTTDAPSGKLSIAPFEEANDFPNAKLALTNVSTADAGDSVKVTFDYDVANYELTKMTEDEHAHHSANSRDGQHIHFIMDNKPYVALYKPTHTVTLAKNSEHHLLSFLSRSYHLSLKHDAAAVLVKFKIDKDGKYVKLTDPTEPMLFYSRPKGEYKGKDTKNVLLDFYVKNAKISPQDYKVMVSVADTSFTVDKWTPYLINGVDAGDLKIKIALVDKEGKTVNGDYGSIERTSSIMP